MARSTLYENLPLRRSLGSLALSSPSIVLFSMYAGLSSMTEDVECAMKKEQQRIQR